MNTWYYVYYYYIRLPSVRGYEYTRDVINRVSNITAHNNKLAFVQCTYINTKPINLKRNLLFLAADGEPKKVN